MVQTEDGGGQRGQFQRNHVGLQQCTKGNDQLGTGHPFFAGRGQFVAVEQAEGCRNQRQEGQGGILPHGTAPVEVVQVIGRQHIQDAAQQGGFVVAEHLTEAEEGDARRGRLNGHHIGAVGPLYAHAQQTQHRRKVEKQFSVKQGGRVPVTILGLGIDAHRELPVPQPLGDALDAGQMEPPVGPLATAAVHQHGYAAQQRDPRQQPEAPPQVGVLQRPGTARHQKQQAQVHQREQYRPPQHTGPGVEHILPDFHITDGKDTTVVSGHQTDGVAGVIHIKHHGVLLGQHIHPGQFPADCHLLRRRKVDAGPMFGTVCGTVRFIVIRQRDAVMACRKRHGRGLQNGIPVGHLGHTAAALLVVADLGVFRDLLPLVRREGVDRRRLHRRPDRPQQDQQLDQAQNPHRRAAQQLRDCFHEGNSHYSKQIFSTISYFPEMHKRRYKISQNKYPPAKPGVFHRRAKP